MFDFSLFFVSLIMQSKMCFPKKVNRNLMRIMPTAAKDAPRIMPRAVIACTKSGSKVF